MNKFLQNILSLTAMKDKEHDMPIKLKLMAPLIKIVSDNIKRNINVMLASGPHLVLTSPLLLPAQRSPLQPFGCGLT